MEKKIEEGKKNSTSKLTYEQLREYYDTSCGCFCIDRDPHEVDIDWIRKKCMAINAY